MKCQYRFKLNGKVTLSEFKLIEVRGLKYEFDADENGLITHIRITRPLANPTEWPEFKPASIGGLSYDLNLNDTRLPGIKLEMQSLQAALSMFGVDGIESDYPEIAWIPENDTEKHSPRVDKFELWQDNDFPACPLSFSLMARTVIAAIDLLEVELPLSFFRHGKMAYHERKYIEAIYQFYFLFETLFGNGKTRNEAIKKEFKKSGPLRSAAEEFLQTVNPFLSHETARRLHEKTKGFDADRLIEYMVDLRGFLHHHTSKRKNMWHPSRQNDYSIDALMFSQVAFRIYTGLLFKYVEAAKIMDAYQKMQCHVEATANRGETDQTR